MRMFPKEFPPDRRNMPKRRAERSVHEALAGSDRQGFVYYEWRKGYGHIELDFAVWCGGLGRFALQVKGGHYLLIDGEWHLKTRDGVRLVESCPLDETKLAALDLHDDIEKRAGTGYSPFVIPVLVCPDMEPDEAIVKLARRKGVYLVWGNGRLMADLADIVRSQDARHPLTAGWIGREVYAVTDGLIRLEEAGDEQEASEVGSRDPDPGRERTATFRLTVGGITVLSVRAGAGKISVAPLATKASGVGRMIAVHPEGF